MADPALAHPLLEEFYWLAQIGLFFLAVIAAAAAWRQLRTTRLFELLRHIERPDVRKARRIVMTEIKGSNVPDWWDKKPEWEEAAATVCAFYDHLGLVIQFDRHCGQIDRVGKFFVEHWAGSICPLHKELKTYLPYRRRNISNAYEGFDWLYKQAEPYFLGKT